VCVVRKRESRWQVHHRSNFRREKRAFLIGETGASHFTGEQRGVLDVGEGERKGM